MRSLALSIVLACAAAALAGCGDGESSGGDATAREGEARRLPVATGPEATARPKPEVPQGPTSGDLIVRDVVIGAGPLAEDGDIMLVRFVAGIYETGKEIESAGRPEPVGFLLGSGDWSIGWESGVRGMRVGGRRIVVFPTSRDALPPGVELGDTLVYVVDLVGLSNPAN